jgi:short-subunit dehydrogenase
MAVSVMTGVDFTSDEQVGEMAATLASGAAFDIVINNAGYFWEEEVGGRGTP